MILILPAAQSISRITYPNTQQANKQKTVFRKEPEVINKSHGSIQQHNPFFDASNDM